MTNVFQISWPLHSPDLNHLDFLFQEISNAMYEYTIRITKYRPKPRLIIFINNFYIYLFFVIFMRGIMKKIQEQNEGYTSKTVSSFLTTYFTVQFIQPPTHIRNVGVSVSPGEICQSTRFNCLFTPLSHSVMHVSQAVVVCIAPCLLNI